MNWYAVYTKPRQERRALENLEQQSFEAYLPQIDCKRSRGGKWVEQIEPLFPRYLFVRLEPGATSTESIRSTRGVTGLVRFGNQLATVPDDFVFALKESADPETGIHTRQNVSFQSGDNVVITDGPLQSLQAVFKTSDGELRAIILMSILGAETNVVVPITQLERAS